MRWFSFEIAAIDPFISTLEPEQQQKLKEQLAEKLFGQDRVIEDRPTKLRGDDSKCLIQNSTHDYNALQFCVLEF